MEVSTASPNELTHAPPGQTETLSLTFPPEGESTAWPNAVLVATVFAPLMLVAWLNWWRAETRPTTGPTRQTWRDHERSKVRGWMCTATCVFGFDEGLNKLLLAYPYNFDTHIIYLRIRTIAEHSQNDRFCVNVLVADGRWGV